MSTNPEFVPEWDVYRDGKGDPVTISVEQMYAIWHAIRVVDRVRATEDHQSLWAHPHPDIEISKSRLLGRMLLDGLPPTKTKPPYVMGGPYWRGLPDGDPFTGERDEQRRWNPYTGEFSN